MGAWLELTDALVTDTTIDGAHGRIEIRRDAASHEVSWLFPDRRYPDEVAFRDLVTMGIVEARAGRAGKVARERRHYLSSTPLDVRTLACAVRAHWPIENRRHRVLNVVFRGDLARLRIGHGPENMAVVKHLAVNLLGRAKPATSLKNRRKLAARNLDDLETLIRPTA